MKKLEGLKLTKQIICIITVLMLCNFIIPNYSYAVATEGGGKLLEHVSQFFCFIPDTVINFLQEMFITPQNIKVSAGNYKILYSPGTIFSGQIPAFDINFIKPVNKDAETKVDINKIGKKISLGKAKFVEELDDTQNNQIIENIKNSYNYSDDMKVEIDLEALKYAESGQAGTEIVKIGETHYNASEIQINLAWVNPETSTLYVIIEHKYKQVNPGENAVEFNISKKYFYEMDLSMREYESLAFILQNPIATWYNALRRIALVGLLSVLVYIGIRIVLTSTSVKDKAKYKAMLKDWLVALCLLFALHYIMNITVTVVNKINDVLSISVVGEGGQDVLMSSIRNKIAIGADWSAVLTYVVMYNVLTVYIIIYTIQYIKRVIYLGFLTMIAPLITLTYPIDKIKDKKSQAFDMWIKDYIFFTLIQVLHLLIYYVFLGSALDLSSQGNWLFAIVAIGFITKAEKIMKKMFGFEKSKSMGALAAGATGALVMNVLNKVKAPKKEEKGKSSGEPKQKTNNIRTATVNPIAVLTTRGEGASQNRVENSNEFFESPQTNGLFNNNPQEVNRPNTSRKTNSRKHGSKMPETIENNKVKRSITKGGWALTKKYGGKVLKAMPGATLGALLGGTGAIVGLSAGIAQGDLMAATTGLFVGGKAGYSLGQRGVNTASKIADKVKSTADSVVDTYREGAYGEEYARNARFDKEFRNSSDYAKLKQNPNFSDEKVQQMLDAGITDFKRMDKILKNNAKHPRKYSMQKAIAYSEMAATCKKEILYDNDNFIRFCNDKNITELSQEELEKLRGCIVEFK